MANGLNIANQLRTDYIQQPAMSAIQAPFNALKMQTMKQNIGMNELQMERLRQELASFQLKNDDEMWDFWDHVKPEIDVNNWPKVRMAAILKGVPESILPAENAFQGPNGEQELMDWKFETDKAKETYKSQFRKSTEKEPKAIKTWVLPDGRTVNLPNNMAPPEGAVPYSTGMDIEVGPEGTRIRTGVKPGAATVEKKTKGAIEEKIMSGHEQLARMQAIYSEFKPEYQEIGTRFANAWTSFRASMGRDVSKEDADALTDFKKFQRKAIENINLYIKEMTGAQMSEKEADRLRLAQPDPGEKWWQGDDPITFKAKMDDVLKMTRAAVARYEYYRAKGLGDAQIKAIVNDNSAVSLESIAAKMK